MEPMEALCKKSPMSTASRKSEKRREMRALLADLSPQRRQEAAEKAKKRLLAMTATMTASEDPVLSFANLAHECDLWTVNKTLASQGKLLLPKMSGKKLLLYKVSSLETLVANRWNIYEPDPAVCLEISPENIRFALVPALAFDKQNHRLGYGGGYYDRLLEQFSEDAITIGVGFVEQMTDTLPIDPWDRVLSQIQVF